MVVNFVKFFKFLLFFFKRKGLKMSVVGFIGGGNMSSAVGHSLIKAGLYKPSNVWVSGPHLENLTKWKDLGANVTMENSEVILHCDIIFLGVKPQLFTKAIGECQGKNVGDTSNKVFVSMLAGVKLEKLIEVLKSIAPKTLVIRTMPNTPMLVSQGVCLYTPGPSVTGEQCSKVKKILESCGVAEEIKEEMIDPFGAMTGCGPAFMYLVLEALSDGAVKQGVPRALASKYAAHVMAGAAKMALETGLHPARLKDEVCSPGGSTICGVAELESNNVRSAIIKAIEVSAKRNIELGNIK